MTHTLADDFCWSNTEEYTDEKLTDSERYQKIVSWAGKARGQNPMAFDALTEWLLDDAEWGKERLAENKQILMEDVLGRFRQQNAWLRAQLSRLEPSDLVNRAVFKALDRFDCELSGTVSDGGLQKAVAQMFTNFAAMGGRGIREQVAGGKTGPTGTDYVQLYGYINGLKDSDAAVQWALFMPSVVERQQNGFKVDSFAYKTMPAMRFIGWEEEDSDDAANVELRKGRFQRLDAMSGCRSGFDYDVFLMHHYGMCGDVGPWHGFWGRFMKPGTAVPEGFLHFDFVPYNSGGTGAPYLSQFAYATFSGDMEAMHRCEGFDGDAMYDVTRNIILGQGVNIPYPDKYWTAEVFVNGYAQHSTAYMFSVDLSER